MENQRVRITKMLLKDALTKLLYEKKIDKITVSELCDKAGINRSTFYKHYGSQMDVLVDLENDFFSAANEMLTMDKENGASGISSFLKFLKDEREKIYVILMLGADVDFINRFFDMPALHSFWNRNYDKELTERQNEYKRKYEYNGGYAVIREWVSSGFKEEPEEIEFLLLRLSGQ